MQKITFLLFLFITISANSQTLTKQLIITDTQDSILLKADESRFDKNGNYFFEIFQNDLKYWITSNDTVGGFLFTTGVGGHHGEIDYIYYKDDIHKPSHYRNKAGTKIYKNALGRFICFSANKTKNNIGIVTQSGNYLHYYINGKLVHKKKVSKSKNYNHHDTDWCVFSENGNVIYEIKKGNYTYLYVNHELVDKTEFSYTEFRVNNNGQYVFAKGKRPKTKMKYYDYMFFLHTNDSSFGQVRTAWNCELKDNGAYFYSGSDKGASYILINNQLKKGISDIDNITLIDKDNFLYTYDDSNSTKINVNKTDYTLDFEKIYHPTMDTLGNFACYGLKDYYLYKYINGKTKSEPITKYNVRPKPIYISPKGVSLHYFKTDDSLYLYQDDKQLFPTIHKNGHFEIVPHDRILSEYPNNKKVSDGNRLFYLEYDSIGYIVYNGTFSEPMPMAYASYYSPTQSKNKIVAGAMNEHGFFIIQKIGEQQFRININNQTYYTIENVDFIHQRSYFFDGQSLIFYGINNLSFFQYKLTL